MGNDRVNAKLVWLNNNGLKHAKLLTRKDLHRLIKKKRVRSEREAEAGENSLFLGVADGGLRAYVSPLRHLGPRHH
jgi:hypothetical protein